MALFKFGGKSREPAAPPSVETLRRRARQRLVGAAILVAAAVLGFPLVFDAAPRPVAVDVPIVVPDKSKLPPLQPLAPTGAISSEPGSSSVASAGTAVGSPSPSLAAPAASPGSAPTALATPAPASPAPAPAQGTATPPARTVASPSGSSAAPLNSASAPAPARAQASSTSAAPAAAKPAPAPAPAAKASAPSRPLATGTPSPELAALPAIGRYVVQVGAFADPAKVREVRQKVERAGLKTYTQDVVTEEGKRTRVRVGPLASKAEAERVAAKLKALGLPGAVLFL